MSLIQSRRLVGAWHPPRRNPSRLSVPSPGHSPCLGGGPTLQGEA